MHVVALISPYTQISATLHLLPSVFSIFAALRCALLLNPYIFIDNILLELIILVTVDSDQFDQISFDFVLNIIDS